MTRKSKIIYFFVSLVFFIVFDLYLSSFILDYGYKLPVNSIVDIVFVQNQGAAFSLLEGSRWFLIIFALMTSLAIIFYAIKNLKNWRVYTVFLVAMLNAGIITNMCERFYFGYVRDYIKINFFDFPIFNISDIFINLSVFAIVVIILINKYAKTNENSN